jgi:hypothetical protein
MTRKMGIKWHLREIMATRGMFNTSDLVGPLAERGVRLSREQVFRLVTADGDPGPEALAQVKRVTPVRARIRRPGD